MKITSVRLGCISVPLRTPFKTALRSVSSVEDVIVEIHTDCGAVGYGEAPPTGAITGDTTGAIIGAIQDHMGSVRAAVQYPCLQASGRWAEADRHRYHHLRQRPGHHGQRFPESRCPGL